MGMKKLVYLPLPPHIYKFVKASRRYDFIRTGIKLDKTSFLKEEIDCLKILHYIPLLSWDDTYAKKWFANVPPNYHRVVVEMYDPTLLRLFYLFKFLEDKFHEQLIEHMHIQKEISNNAKLGLDKFLDKCDISEADYKIATGYKQWQRYQNKLKKKRMNGA